MVPVHLRCVWDVAARRFVLTMQGVTAHATPDEVCGVVAALRGIVAGVDQSPRVEFEWGGKSMAITADKVQFARIVEYLELVFSSWKSSPDGKLWQSEFGA